MPPPFGRAAAGEAASRAAGKNREPLGIGELEKLRHFFGIGRVDHRIRQELHLGGIVGVAEEILLIGGDIVGADDGFQFLR